MRFKALLSFSAIILILPGWLYAGDLTQIAGIKIPLIEGAVPSAEEPAQPPNARLTSYSTHLPLEKVVEFYQNFLKGNGFTVIRGQEGGGFDISAKKGRVMFSLRIYSRGGRTLIQFIW